MSTDDHSNDSPLTSPMETHSTDLQPERLPIGLAVALILATGIGLALGLAALWSALKVLL